jgi:hypothetical protein
MVRFKRKDATMLRIAAAQDDEIVTVWIRETVLMRLSMLETKPAPDMTPLKYETAGGFGEPMSIRFQTKDYRRIVRAAHKELQLPTAWIRAVAVSHAAAKAGARVPAQAAAS